MSHKSISIKNKALSINLDSEKYGVIAEIGGGQEVARAFFQAGGASGTVAKSISAYDKTFSDALYNKHKPGRYVSEDRLVKMLDSEYHELTKTLQGQRGDETAFFVFANTVEILNFHKTNKGHGWMGVKFQISPDGPVNTVILHTILHENDASLQQYTLGALGINLIHACFNHYERPNEFLRSLMDNLDRDRVEVNMINMQGEDLEYVDNRLLSVQLVKNGMTSVSIFDRNGKVMRPAELFYKKHVMVLRGSFRPLTYTLVDMLRAGTARFRQEVDFHKQNSVTLCEMTINQLENEGTLDEKDFLDRVDVLNDNGQHVMITDFKEFYKLSQYFTRHKILDLRIVLGVNTLQRVMQDVYYKDLPGGILHAMGLLFPNNAALYSYPTLNEDGTIKQTEDIIDTCKEDSLLQYLIEKGKIVDISARKRAMLTYTPRMVMQLLCDNNPEWEKCVPVRIAEMIKEKQLFGFKPQS